MNKRRHSPSVNSSGPPSKIHRTLFKPDTSTSRLALFTFDTILYDELILVIFSYLSYSDLCAVQLTNRNCARLALDNQLWKALYMVEFGRTRLRGVRARKGCHPGRDIKPLPGRVAASLREDDILDWKWMFKLARNWRTGRCAVEELDEPQNPDSIPSNDESTTCQIHILLAGNLIITTSASDSFAPAISLVSPTHGAHALHALSIELNTPTRITTLALDQSLSSSHTCNYRVVAVLSTGEFSVFTVDPQSPSLSTRMLTYVPSSRTDRTTPIIQTVYHHPVIITLSKSFKLSIYDLSREDAVRHVQTLSSFSSYPPSSIVISQLAGPQRALKVVLVYSVPMYPSHWGAGATELIISLSGDENFASSSVTHATVTSSRTIRAFDIPSGWIDERKLKMVKEQWGRRVSRIADTQTDGKWVVLAPAPLSISSGPPPSPPSSSSSSLSSSPLSSTYRTTSLSNALQLYRLSLPAYTSIASPKLTFVRNLFGPEGEIDRIWVADGRCVSLGIDGSIWVWDLEEGRGGTMSRSSQPSCWLEGAEVAAGSGPGPGTCRGTVVFDESRIVSAFKGVLNVRRFDV